MSRNSTTYDCLVTLGSNQGDSINCLNDAVNAISKHPQVEIVSTSSWHATAAIGGPEDQPEFLNGAVRLITSMSPHQLHRELISIETGLGRERIERWGPRSIDLDLIIHGDQILNDQALRLPHPRMTYRRFVLHPAVEVATDLCDPRTQLSLGDYLRILNERANLVHVSGCDERLFCEIASEVSLSPDTTRFVVTENGPEWDHRCGPDLFDSRPLHLLSPDESVSWMHGTSHRGSSARFVITSDQAKRRSALRSKLAKLQIVIDSKGDEKLDSPYLLMSDMSPREMAIELQAAIEAMR